MKLSFLQLNINADNYWEPLSKYLTTHQYDILHFQEVVGKGTVIGNTNAKRDMFNFLQTLLGADYQGVLVKTETFTSSPLAYQANATFFKKDFTLIDKKELIMKHNAEPFLSNATSFEEIGRKLLHLTLGIQDKQLSLLNTHFAWAKTSEEHPHQTEQGEMLLSYLKSVKHPFVFSADMNLNPQQPLIKKMNMLARNLTVENHVSNTLNPKRHYAKQLFPPGVAVDYIFTSPDLQVNSFTVIEEDISDHFGLAITFDL